MRKVLSVIAVAALAVSVFSYPAHAVAPAGGGGFDASRGPQGDVKPLPKFVRAWQESKEAAADAVARGKAKPDRDGIVELPNGTFVDYELLGTDHIVVMLATQRSGSRPDC